MGIYSFFKRLTNRPWVTEGQAAPGPQVQVVVQGDRVILQGEVATPAEHHRLLATASRLTGGPVQDLIRVGGAEPGGKPSHRPHLVTRPVAQPSR